MDIQSIIRKLKKQAKHIGGEGYSYAIVDINELEKCVRPQYPQTPITDSWQERFNQKFGARLSLLEVHFQNHGGKPWEGENIQEFITKEINNAYKQGHLDGYKEGDEHGSEIGYQGGYLTGIKEGLDNVMKRLQELWETDPRSKAGLKQEGTTVWMMGYRTAQRQLAFEIGEVRDTMEKGNNGN